MPSTATTITAIAASAALLAYGATRLSKSNAPRDIADIDDLDEDELITPEEVVSVFDKLFMQMQQVVLQLSQQVQQIQMSGQVIPEKQLRQLLKSEFERALQQLQVQVLEEADMDAECLEEATWEFMEEGEKYPKVKRAVERFQALYESVSGVECKGWHPGKGKAAGDGGGDKKELSADELIEAASLYFDKITETMVEMANTYKSQGKDLKDPQVAQQYQMEASSDANEVAEKALEAKGINMSAFRSAIDKHSRVPSVGQTLGMLQLKQQQELMAAGVPMM